MKRDMKIVVLVGTGVLSLWVGSGVLLYCLPDRGTFGDMFGAVNSLFSGLAFVGVVFAILLQREELQLQREELIDTKKTLKETSESQELSAKSLFLQAQSTRSSYQLQALSIALEIVQKQIKEDRNAASGAGKSQISLRLERQKKEIENQMSSLIDQVTKSV